MRQHQAASVPHMERLLSCADKSLARAAPPGERPLVGEAHADAHDPMVRAGSSTGQSAGLIIREVQGSSPCRPTEGEIHGTETVPANTDRGPLAQWQSSGLLTRGFRVRPPGGPPASATSSDGQSSRLLSDWPGVRIPRGVRERLRHEKRSPAGTRT